MKNLNDLMNGMGAGFQGPSQDDIPQSLDEVFAKDEDANPHWDEQGNPKGSQWGQSQMAPGQEPEPSDDGNDIPTPDDFLAVAQQLQQQNDADKRYQDSVIRRNLQRDQRMLAARAAEKMPMGSDKAGY